MVAQIERNPMNILFLDTETTGLDPIRHAIIQLAYVIEIDGDEVCSKVFDLDPQDADMCLPALSVNNFTLERLRAGRPPAYVLEQLITDMRRYVPPSAEPPYCFCAYRASFDFGFMVEAFKKVNDKRWWDWISKKRILDPLPLLQYLDYRGVLDLPDYKLVTVANHFGVASANAHDAMADVAMLRKIWRIADGYFSPDGECSVDFHRMVAPLPTPHEIELDPLSVALLAQAASEGRVK
jgi:DNA polymerase III epsilon subunit-like protein